MSSPFPLVRGVAVCAPANLTANHLAAARELTALNYGDVNQRVNVLAPFGPTADGPVTHMVGNWSITADGFWTRVIQGQLADPAEYPDWVDVDLITEAYANWIFFDPGNLVQTMATNDWDATKLALVPTPRRSVGSIKTYLAAEGLVPVTAESPVTTVDINVNLDVTVGVTP